MSSGNPLGIQFGPANAISAASSQKIFGDLPDRLDPTLMRAFEAGAGFGFGFALGLLLGSASKTCGVRKMKDTN
jgi:hypothetical protein